MHLGARPRNLIRAGRYGTPALAGLLDRFAEALARRPSRVGSSPRGLTTKSKAYEFFFEGYTGESLR
jgi:hypothetical protein